MQPTDSDRECNQDSFVQRLQVVVDILLHIEDRFKQSLRRLHRWVNQDFHQRLDGSIVDTTWLFNFETARSKVAFERLQESTKHGRIDFSDDLWFTELFGVVSRHRRSLFHSC